MEILYLVPHFHFILIVSLFDVINTVVIALSVILVYSHHAHFLYFLTFLLCRFINKSTSIFILWLILCGKDTEKVSKKVISQAIPNKNNKGCVKFIPWK